MTFPATIHKFLRVQLAGVDPAVHQILVLDPLRFVTVDDSGGTIDDEHGRAWQVVVYQGNDLAFRRALEALSKE